ncbi:APC family permease [Mycoplasma sp. 1578d]|uniref:APC family permease n=1 Tax=Mycoplasma sp. 1578d TaxID=2967299 RepID=UPI00211C2AB8|nr:APC family permease [Mycoplasma sp. 1578d]UUM19556.1 APC family permease [Mycoplasma sp. 1578d]
MITDININKKPFSSKQFIGFGINFIAGFAFVAIVLSLFSIGPLWILVFAICSLIALAVMLSFSKMSESSPERFGGPYIYASEAFGRKTLGARMFVFLTGWNNYVGPLIASATVPLFLVSVFASFIDKNNTTAKWGLILGGLFIFVFLIFISTLGYQLSKGLIFTFAFVKWLILFSSLIFAIVLIAQTAGIGFSENYLLTYNNKPREISLPKIVAISTAFFYAYGGFEDLACMSPEVKTKSFKKDLNIIFIIVFIIYAFGIVIFSGLPVGDGSSRASIRIKNYSDVYRAVGGIVALSFFAIGSLSNSIASRISGSLTASYKLVPLSEDGYLPKYFLVKNSKNKFSRIIYLTLALSLGLMILIFFGSLINDKTDFDLAVTRAAGISGASGLFQYVLGFITFFVYYHKGKIKDKTNWRNITSLIIQIVSLVLILIILFIFFFPIDTKIVQGKSIVFLNWTIQNTLNITLYPAVLLLGYIMFFIAEHNAKKNTRINLTSIQNSRTHAYKRKYQFFVFNSHNEFKQDINQNP